MLKILWKRGEIAPEEQFLLLSTIFCYLMLDFYVKTRIRFSLRDKRLFKIIEVEITRIDCNNFCKKELYHKNCNTCINIFNLLCQTLLRFLKIIGKDSFYRLWKNSVQSAESGNIHANSNATDVNKTFPQTFISEISFNVRT